MKDVEFTTSASRMFAVVGIMLLISATAYVLNDVTGKEVFQMMSAVISTLALVMFTQAK